MNFIVQRRKIVKVTIHIDDENIDVKIVEKTRLKDFCDYCLTAIDVEGKKVIVFDTFSMKYFNFHPECWEIAKNEPN